MENATGKTPGKVIAIEEQQGPFQMIFQRVMRLVPDRDKDDKNLQRLIAFRLRQDGEASVSEYLINKIRESIKCTYTGRFYDFIKDDIKQKECLRNGEEPEPPDVA